MAYIPFLNNAYFSAKVGIGTDSPDAKLEVADIGADSAGLLLSAIPSTNVNFSFIVGDTALGLHSKNLVIKGSSGSSDIAFSPSSSYPGLLTLDGSAGNVGIGTTNPGEKLEVDGGSLKVSNAYATVKIIGTGGLSRVFLGDTADEDVGYLEYNHISNYFRVGVNAAERMRITSSGNVGIGTTAPTNKLDVSGVASVTSLKVGSSASGEGIIRYNPGLGNGIGITTGALSSSGIGLFVSHQNNNRNVGIGTTSPSAKLEVYAGASSGAAANSDDNLVIEDSGNSFINLKTPTSGISGLIFSDATRGRGQLTYDHNADAMRFVTQGSEKMRITSVGNVGIGTTTPIALGGHSGILTLYGSNATALVLKDVVSEGHLRFDDSNFKFTNSSGQVRMQVEADTGNVGIGTTAPSYPLDVNGNARVNGNLYFASNYINYTSGTTALRASGNLESVGTFRTYSNLTADGVLTVSGTGNSSIVGNVGIGTTNPGYKLDVSGGLRATAESTFTNNLLFPDNSRIKMGSGNDLQIYHSGTHSFIDGSNGAGSLYIRPGSGGTIQLETTTGTDMIVGASSAVTLYSSGNSKLSTGAVSVGAATTTGGTLIDGWKTTTQANAINNTTIATTAYVNNLIGTIPAGLVFQGTWNAATNTPTLTSGSGTTGNFYIVSTSGSTNLDGVTDWVTGDWAVFIEQGGTDAWEKIDNSSVLDGAGTGNKLTKWSGSGTSNTLTDSIVTDNGNDLDVNGGVTADYFRTDTNSGDYSLISRDSAGNATLYVQQANTSASQPIAFFSYGSATANQGSRVLAVGKDISYFDNCNVGIGTTSPISLLQVGTNLASNGVAYIGDYDSSFATNFFYRNQTAAQSTVPMMLVRQTNINDDQPVLVLDQDGTGDILQAFTDSSQVVTIDYLGNVGIGTTSPSYKLQSSGTIAVASNIATNAIRLSIDEATTFPGSNTSATRLLNFVGSNAGPNTEIGGIRWLNTDGDSGNYQYHAAGITSHNSGESNDGDLRFFVSSNASADSSTGVIEAMRINPTGNVGIGTTSPAAKLHVTGNNVNASEATVRIGGVPSFGNGVSRLELVENMSANVMTYGFSLTADGNSTNNLLIRNHSNSTVGNVAIAVDRITSNVGIGTTSPTFKLHVNSTDASDNVAYIHHNNAAQSSGDVLKVRSDAGDNAGSALLNVANNTGSALYVRGDRNVGIGTTSPLYKLDVSGSIRAGGKLTYSKSAGSLSTTGYAVAGLLAGSNGNSCMFTFTAIGNAGHYQKVVYSCWNAQGTWNTSKVIDEGTNGLDIEASTNASTITFTFKSRSGSLNYSPRVTIEASGHAINNTYA